MKGFQKKNFLTTFHHQFQTKKCDFRFQFEGKNDAWISQVRRVNIFIVQKNEELENTKTNVTLLWRHMWEMMKCYGVLTLVQDVKN